MLVDTSTIRNAIPAKVNHWRAVRSRSSGPSARHQARSEFIASDAFRIMPVASRYEHALPTFGRRRSGKM